MGKSLIAIIVILVGLGWAIASGFVQWKTDPEKCLFGKSFHHAGSRQTLVTIGRLHIFYQPLTWDCPYDEKYRTDEYRLKDGILEPIKK